MGWKPAITSSTGELCFQEFISKKSQATSALWVVTKGIVKRVKPATSRSFALRLKALHFQNH
jgi:hypothetical protein